MRQERKRTGKGGIVLKSVLNEGGKGPVIAFREPRKRKSQTKNRMVSINRRIRGSKKEGATVATL